jgi:SAM-dependent methyltransferase
MEHKFTEVYNTCEWGNNRHEEYRGSSGEGSDIDYNISTYVPFLQKFITDHDVRTVVDVGCGDFRCGPYIYDSIENVKYTGIDVYKNVIDYHRKTYHNNPKYTFVHMDVSQNMNNLPAADLCILKDVLQHWPTDQIYTFLDILMSTKQYKYILITNCSHQKYDNENIVVGHWRPLSYEMLPLKKYPIKLIYTYNTKQVCLIQS